MVESVTGSGIGSFARPTAMGGLKPQQQVFSPATPQKSEGPTATPALAQGKILPRGSLLDITV